MTFRMEPRYAPAEFSFVSVVNSPDSSQCHTGRCMREAMFLVFSRGVKGQSRAVPQNYESEVGQIEIRSTMFLVMDL
jgi:hypothetical protein